MAKNKKKSNLKIFILHFISLLITSFTIDLFNFLENKNTPFIINFIYNFLSIITIIFYGSWRVSMFKKNL
ncbi:hypothetical protein AB834_04390 [PVC group bacterium (ex Bugula neritina AB1)]|nr:hypothetical protein AB834_04390 [PVC group bacterium (ex Bugula neritina AB1)]